jgi:hypothetical protein
LILQEQLGKPQQLRETFPLSGLADVGLLGNLLGQQPSSQAPGVVLVYSYWNTLNSEPGMKLARLKQQKFTPKGKAQRVAASVTALYAPQPIELPPAQWKEIVEEIEDIED